MRTPELNHKNQKPICDLYELNMYHFNNITTQAYQVDTERARQTMTVVTIRIQHDNINPKFGRPTYLAQKLTNKNVSNQNNKLC